VVRPEDVVIGEFVRARRRRDVELDDEEVGIVVELEHLHVLVLG
jgi:hypothetical protein